MNSIALIASALSIVLICLCPLHVVGHGTKCGGEQVDFSESELNHINECLKLVGAKTMKDLGIENGACFFKCTLEKKGIMDSKGVARKDKIADMINVAIKAKVKENIKVGLGKCFDEESKGIKMTGDDDMCSTFMPLVMCVHGTFLENC